MEGRVLAGVRNHLLQPHIVASFTQALQEELASVLQEDQQQRSTLSDQLASTRSRIGRLVDQIEGEPQPPRSLVTRLAALEGEEDELVAALASLAVSSVPELPKDHGALFQHAIAEIETHLAVDDAAPVRVMLRRLIERVVVHAGDSRGGKRRPIELHGDLYALLGGADTTTPHLVGAGRVVTSLVAGTRADLDLRRSQFEIVAGAHNDLNLLASQVELVAGGRTDLNLLFQAAA